MILRARLWGDKLRGAVSSVVQRLTATPTVPFCVAYTAGATFISPPASEMKRRQGLIAWHVVQTSADNQIISYWQDEQHFQTNRADFERKLGLNPHYIFQGQVGELRQAGSTWWPSSFKEAVIALAAVVGAVTVIWNATDVIWGTISANPSAEISFPATSVDLLDGETAQVSASITNATEFHSVQSIPSAKLLVTEQALQFHLCHHFTKH